MYTCSLCEHHGLLHVCSYTGQWPIKMTHILKWDQCFMWNVICVKNQFLYVQLCKIMHDLFCKPGLFFFIYQAMLHVRDLDLIDQIMFFLSLEKFSLIWRHHQSRPKEFPIYRLAMLGRDCACGHLFSIPHIPRNI